MAFSCSFQDKLLNKNPYRNFSKKDMAPGVELVSWAVFQRRTLHLSFKDYEPNHYQGKRKLSATLHVQ